MYPDDALRRALDDAYTAFAEYPRPGAMHASPIRDSRRIEALLEAPLRALGPDIVDYYATCAMTTVGEVEDYKYFLPRILELAVASALIEPDMIANKLLHGDWREWPSHEIDAIAGVFQAAFTQAIGEHTNSYLAEPWFLGAVRLGLDVDAFMRIWEAGPLPNAMLQLSGLWNTQSLFRSKLNGMWAQIDGHVVRALRAWLLSEEIGDRLILAGTLASDRDIWIFDTALSIRDAVAHEFT